VQPATSRGVCDVHRSLNHNPEFVFPSRGKDAVDQFVCLRGTADYSGMDFSCETYVQRRIVYCHYPFWREHDFTGQGVTAEQRDDLIARLEKRWEISDIPFPLPRLKNQDAEQAAT